MQWSSDPLIKLFVAFYGWSSEVNLRVLREHWGGEIFHFLQVRHNIHYVLCCSFRVYKKNPISCEEFFFINFNQIPLTLHHQNIILHPPCSSILRLRGYHRGFTYFWTRLNEIFSRKRMKILCEKIFSNNLMIDTWILCQLYALLNISFKYSCRRIFHAFKREVKTEKCAEKEIRKVLMGFFFQSARELFIWKLERHGKLSRLFIRAQN